MIYLIAGYYFLVATIFVMNSKTDFIFINRKYLFGALLMGTGIFFGRFFHEIGEMIGVILGCLFAVTGIIPIYQKIRHKEENVEVLHLPKDSYQIVSFEQNGKYMLKHEDASYILSSIPPKGTPALKVYVSRVGENTFATIVEEDRKFGFQDLYGILLYIIAFLLPVLLCFTKDQPDLFEKVLGATLGILIFHGSYKATMHSEETFGKLFHKISLVMSVILWLSVLINILLFIFHQI